MEKKNRQAVPPELLSKEFLSQFRTEEDVSSFLTDLHAQVQEGNNTGNSRNGSFPKTIQTQHGQSVIQVPRDRNADFEPIAVPKHQSRGLSIERLIISL